MDAVAMMMECTEQSMQGKMPFPEVVRRLHAVGVERYHVDLTRDEMTVYLPSGESHRFPTHGPRDAIGVPFDVVAVQGAIRAIQAGEIGFPEFLRRIMAAGCVGYFTQIAGRRVQYIGRTGETHVEPFPPANASGAVMQVNGILETALHVADPAKSAAFYRRLFGLTVLL